LKIESSAAYFQTILFISFMKKDFNPRKKTYLFSIILLQLG